ncbi:MULTISPECIES: hypothetical protein [Serratia]|uniref:hypothetical protein n=1 Tax=Serratia TaxID=613 RepID=UPI00037378B5|nr:MULTISPECIES: hypothetical protein [Serratia]MCS4264762.1 hypothetical protein [Serratia sp. BIGb0163]
MQHKNQHLMLKNPLQFTRLLKLQKAGEKYGFFSAHGQTAAAQQHFSARSRSLGIVKTAWETQ